MKINKIAILGAGSWGTALAALWSKKGCPVTLWSRDAERAGRMRQSRQNSDYLPGLQLAGNVNVTSDLRACADVDLIIFVMPSTALRDIADRLGEVTIRDRAILLSCTKGIERGTGLRMTQILAERFPRNRVAVLSGPNLAVEVAQDLPTATVIGCEDAECAALLQDNLGGARFRIYTSPEVVSIELGGALKNVFALAAGISDGLRLGDNAKAALVTRSLAEMVRLGEAMGGRPGAFHGLSGVGDLIVTCYSERSRNHTVGKWLGQGETLAKITASMKMVAEGIPTAQSARERGKMLNIDIPIIDQVYAMVYEQKAPLVALEELLNREQKSEQA